MRNVAFAFFAFVAISAPVCAKAPPPAQAYFNSPPQEVAARLSGVCMDAGMTVSAADAMQVLCGKEVGGFKGIMTQLLIGNSYSTTPIQYARFQLVPWNSGTRVQVSEWVETQMAFGQIQRLPLNNNKQTNAMLEALYRLGGTAIPTLNGVALPQNSTATGTPAPPSTTFTSSGTAGSAPGTIDLGSGVQLVPTKSTMSGYCIKAPSDYQGSGSVNRPAVTKARPLCS